MRCIENCPNNPPLGRGKGILFGSALQSHILEIVTLSLRVYARLQLAKRFEMENKTKSCESSTINIWSIKKKNLLLMIDWKIDNLHPLHGVATMHLQNGAHEVLLQVQPSPCQSAHFESAVCHVPSLLSDITTILCKYWVIFMSSIDLIWRKKLHCYEAKPEWNTSSSRRYS